MRPDATRLAPLPAWAGSAVRQAAAVGGDDIPAALDIATGVGAALPVPGRGSTPERWTVLAALARADVTVARVAEAHTDALAVLAEAGVLDADLRARTWGVFAAEAPGEALVLDDDGTVTGGKPWCSLAGVLDAALVTATDRQGERQLVAVDLHHPGVAVRPADGWVSRGLRSVVSVGVDFAAVPATPVGGRRWYLERPGFAWGGMGVAACWFGAAEAVADRLPHPDGELAALAAGRVDAALHAAACTLRDAAAAVDTGRADGRDGARLALRVRAVVAGAATAVLDQVGQATGPAPLTFDARHAARVADLTVYLRQHHGDRDLAALGRSAGEAP